jgi:hypothetical protein
VLSEDALMVIDEWPVWLFTGVLPENGILGYLRDQLFAAHPASPGA